MALSFQQKQAITEMADLLYDFLPGSGASHWRGHVSFATVARQVGVGNFWVGGSKKPAIVQLLQMTLDQRAEHFTRLIEEIVDASLTYRSKGNRSLTKEEIEKLNSLLLRANFKIPGLWEESFLGSLPHAETTNTVATNVRVQDPPRGVHELERQLEELKDRYIQLQQLSDRQQAGRLLEQLLNDLFALFGLEPRPPFRAIGEQIDGSFLLDFETYLVEAKWTKARIQERELLVFKGKVEGKSAFTRGMFLSVNGFTDGAIDAITRGRSPTFFLVDGYDLYLVLDGKVSLTDLLRYKIRRLTEEGLVLARFPAAESGSATA